MHKHNDEAHKPVSVLPMYRLQEHLYRENVLKRLLWTVQGELEYFCNSNCNYSASCIKFETIYIDTVTFE
jgi:hypothetical protein